MSWYDLVLNTMSLAILATGTATLALLRWPVRCNKPAPLTKKLPSPRETLLPYLSAEQVAASPYPSDLLPGARDVDTSYGMMRVYEWGPDEGMKVLLIHGDTTPGPMLGPIASQLAERGCRVMILELWGRGYSDTPLDAPHDSRLFTTQIFFAIASSSISWTGAASGGFSIVGFSLGGGITMAFAAHFPYLINSIVLLAPVGILRYIPDDYKSFLFRHASFIPGKYVRRAVGKLLGVPSPETGEKLSTGLKDIDSVPEAVEETALVGQKKINVKEIVQWQFDHHKGFCHSFVDTIRHGPIMNQHSDWRRVCDLIKDKKPPLDILHADSKLRNSKLFVIFGDSDSIVVADDILTDLHRMLGGHEHLVHKIVPGGHGFPIFSCGEVVGHISEFWHI